MEVKEDLTKKKYYGLGGYLPKVSSYLLQKPQISTRSKTGSDDSSLGDHELRSSLVDENELIIENTSTQDKSYSTLRTSALSIEQTASSIYRKMPKLNIRHTKSMPNNQETRYSDANSIDGNTSRFESFTRLSTDLDWSKYTYNLPSPRSAPTLKARRGTCVSTIYGTGHVLDIRLEDRFWIVQLVFKGLAYLHEDAIIREIKAVVGERVKTRWGLATVEQYYPEDDMYSIALDWRWDDDHVWRMKATTKKFEKLPKENTFVHYTKNRIYEGYSTLRGNVVAKISSSASAIPPLPQVLSLQVSKPSLGKAMTPFGIGDVINVRPDEFFVVKMPWGAIAYFHAESIKLIQRRTHFMDGDKVKTPYGLGQVVKFRNEDEMYEIALDMGNRTTSMNEDITKCTSLYISDVNAEHMMVAATSDSRFIPTGQRLSSIFSITRDSVYSASATMKASASGGFTTLSSVKARVSTIATNTYKQSQRPKFAKGERVVTTFGSGFITDIRPQDKIYEVYLRRLKFNGYFHESTLSPFPYDRVTHMVVNNVTIPAPEIPKQATDTTRRAVIEAAIRAARETPVPGM